MAYKNKEDQIAYHRKYYKKNKEMIDSRNKEWQKKNPNYIKDYYQQNKEKLKLKNRIHYSNNREYCLKWCKEYSKRHPEINRNNVNRWRKNNRIKARSQSRARYHKLRGDKCEICNTTRKLHFHHTDYEKDEGLTVCAYHHVMIHKMEVKT